ncbi:hypothetical protein PLEOSDRAFT_1095416 [Pleurotus ostreatus PC15]|uniref:DUF3835 domain-containing protein n=1 Tax=Pleurotus ostreatus (strain PC15) TaxID=1137138 RepID=A0A067NZS7_PLEO1|nr:hypothetical protein PLEOSDRAFT_1095416 [Pleurotus ostreatus PC15]
MPPSTGQTQNLADGSVEEGSAAPPDSDVMKKLTAKLSELVGEDAAKAFASSYDNPAQRLNEEGLPIVEITEPIANSDTFNETSGTSLDDDELTPLSMLSPQERARRKREQERIFDLLEEEERLEQARIDAAESMEREERMEKKGAAKTSLHSMRAQKEMQRKMGKALLNTLGDVKSTKPTEPAKPSAAASTSSKKVSFAEDPTTEGTYAGDSSTISLARLQKLDRPNLISQSSKNTPMKAEVVERGVRGSQPIAPSIAEEDSDDESVQSEVSESGMHHQDDSSRSSEVEDSEDDEDAHGAPQLEDEEYDIDTAQHNREIALAYYAKRETVGAAAREAIEQLEGDEPRDPELAKDSKPSVSRFGAAKMASAYGASAPSQSLPTVIPESSIKTVQSAIRLGKLDDDGRLISATGESSDEETNAIVSEVLDLIKTGKAVNVGPQGSTVHSTVVPPSRRSKQDAKPSTDGSVNDKVITAFNRLEISDAKPPRPPKSATPTRVAQPSTSKVAPPAYNPLIVDSPSYPPQVLSRPQRPPTVMSSKVLETEKRAASPQSTESAPKKVSRFMRERTE